MPAEVTKNYRRQRQFAPSRCVAESFRTMIVDSNTKMIVCCPRGPKHWSKRTKRCKVGTRVQTILKRKR